MKKNYVLFSFCFIVPLLFLGQHTIPPLLEIEPKPSLERPNEWHLQKSKPANVKAFRDTAFYEDFDTTQFVNRGWTITNNNTNNAVWQNTGVFTPGQFSSGTPAIGSTTAANGFMLLNGDRINTPRPPTGPITMDTWFTSDTIWLTGSKVQRDSINSNTVWVSYQQYLRYCCSAANQLVMEVSTNTTDWISFDATDALLVNAANAPTSNPVSTNEINITEAVCGADYIFLRFRSTGNSHYFWMIDDLAVIEGPEYESVLEDGFLLFNLPDSLGPTPFYFQIPEALFPPLNFYGAVSNQGELTAENVEVNIDVHHVGDSLDTNLNAVGSALGYAYNNRLGLDSLTTICDTSSTHFAAAILDSHLFIPKVKGVFDVAFDLTYDSLNVDAIVENNRMQQRFWVTDTVYARDDGTFSNGVGPHSYVTGGVPGGTSAGDRLGLLYRMNSTYLVRGSALSSNRIPTSISFFVSSNNRNVGVEIVPKIWDYTTTPFTQVASNFVPYVVTTADLNSWLTLSLDNGSAVTNGLDSGVYVVGYEVSSIAGNTTFEVWNDASTAALQPNGTAFVYFGHSPASSWGWVAINPGIRLNFGNLGSLTDLPAPEGSKELLTVYPNPSEGNFVLDIQNSAPSNYQLRVLNQLGQVVQEKNINVNGSFQEQMNLAHVEKGLYYLELTGANGRQMKKILIQ